MLMEADRPTSKDLKKEQARLMREAMKRPGIADLIAIYERLETPYLASQKYLEEIKPTISLSNSNSDSTGSL